MMVLVGGCRGGSLDELTGPKQGGILDDGGIDAGLPSTDLPNPTAVEPSVAPVVPFEATKPAAYVAKLKALLTGQAATEAEVTAVETNPSALDAMVDAWMKDPAYQDVLLLLFGRLFQQDAVTANDLGVADNLAAGVDNTILASVRESFARTAMAIVNDDRPFTETMTTQTFMMTVPLMVYYGVIDALQVDDNGRRTDKLAERFANISYSLNPVKTKTNFDDALNPSSSTFMSFNYDGPDLNKQPPACLTDGKLLITVANSRTGITFVENLYHAVAGFDIYSIYTQQYCAGPGGNKSWSADDLRWRLVTLRKVTQGEEPTRFWDVPTLRRANTLALRVPRVGFYTTPAFMGQWASNTSNQARAMVNQTMIVGVGQAFDGSVQTVPIDLRALDQKAFAPNSSCYGCHLTMDPMRQFFRHDYSVFGDGQQDPNLLSIGGVFAAGGKNVQSSNIADLGKLMAQHPNFAAAWTKQICEWATSSTCERDDPELGRLAQVFVDSNYNFNKMVHAVLVSPITTFASSSKSAQRHGDVVSIARRNQFCRNLSARLDMADLCGLLPTTEVPQNLRPVATLAAALAKDDFARGQVASVAVTKPSITFFAGVEKICTLLALQMAGNSGAGAFATSEPDVLAARLASKLMGTTGQAQSQSIDVLRRHIGDAQRLGANVNEAAQSAFVVACTSPQVTALGL